MILSLDFLFCSLMTSRARVSGADGARARRSTGRRLRADVPYAAQVPGLHEFHGTLLLHLMCL